MHQLDEGVVCVCGTSQYQVLPSRVSRTSRKLACLQSCALACKPWSIQPLCSMLHCHTPISANNFDSEQHERLRSSSCEAAGVAYVPSLHSVVLQELRVRGSYLHHKEIKAAQGVKIAAQNLESAVAGTQMLVAGPDDDSEVLKAEVMEDMKDIFGSVDRSGKLLAHSLGSLSVQSSRLCCGVLLGQPAAPLTPFPPPPSPSLFIVNTCRALPT